MESVYQVYLAPELLLLLLLLQHFTAYTFEKFWYRGEKGMGVVELEDCGQTTRPL